jgi:hypothetical protein
MRWFKHYSDNYRGRSVTSFHREFGHTGVSWYFILTEICTEKLERPLDHDLAQTDCSFGFDKAFVESALRGTFAKIERWLRHGVAMGLWNFTTTEFELRLEYPILLELLDSDQRKTRSRREEDATEKRLEKRREDKEVDIEKIKKKKVKFDFSEIFNLYPRKDGKGAGIKKLETMKVDQETFDRIKSAAIRYSNHCRKNKTEPQYIKHFSTWVNHWTDWDTDEAGTAITTNKNYENERDTDHDKEMKELWS